MFTVLPAICLRKARAKRGSIPEEVSAMIWRDPVGAMVVTVEFRISPE
jgi:hypothetical protein